jgi:hypothetical protein
MKAGTKNTAICINVKMNSTYTCTVPKNETNLWVVETHISGILTSLVEETRIFVKGLIN